MSEDRQLTIAEGLKELKLIDKKLRVRYDNIRQYSSKMKGAPDSIEKQDEYVKERRQSAEDLLKNYSAIKMAIQKANLEASFEFKGKTYTLAEAILWKHYLSEHYNALYGAFTAMTARGQIEGERAHRAGLSEDELVKIGMVPHLFYDEREIQERKEELLELTAYIDALIDKTNHSYILKFWDASAF